MLVADRKKEFALKAIQVLQLIFVSWKTFFILNKIWIKYAWL